MIYVFLADGFEEIEALAPVDFLLRAGVEVKTVGVSRRGCKGAHGIIVEADILSLDVELDENLQGIILPGGMPGTINLENSPVVQKAIDYCNENNKLIGAICAAPSILGGMGLLRGKHAISYPSFEEKLIGAIITKNAVVQDGNIITSRGMGTSIDFALKLVEVMAGAEKANEIGDSILYFK
jgi:4-methyl-5(b-hydroxyethyl)-thiazole monophosphate biosynthesis